MQNDSRTGVIAFALVDKLKSIIFHLLQAHSDRPLTERRAIDHTIKKLFITKCLNVSALVQANYHSVNFLIALERYLTHAADLHQTIFIS